MRNCVGDRLKEDLPVARDERSSACGIASAADGKRAAADLTIEENVLKKILQEKIMSDAAERPYRA